MRGRSAIAAVALLGLACAGSQAGSDAQVEGPISKRADVYLVPIGTTPPGIFPHLVAYYREQLGLEVALARALPFYSRIYDAQRKQLIAEELLYLMEVWCEGLSVNPSAIFVGITANDMYARGTGQPFNHAYQAQGRYAVVSSAHLGAPGATEAALVEERVRKIVTQAIGMLYYDLPLNEDPHSVLYARVSTVESIDAIDESTLRRDLLEADAARFR